MNEPVDAGLVRRLLREQHPDLAELELRAVDGGWDNQLLRLGDDLAVRLPRTDRAPELIANELRWLPELAGRLPLPIPLPVRSGRPSPAYPRPWSVVRWVSGEPADRAPIAGSASTGILADFLRALHRPAPPHAPASPTRSIPLAATRGHVEHALGLLDGDPRQDAVRGVYEGGVAAPEWHTAPVWVHADLHPANVVTRDGELCGVIDFGDACAADPANDLAAAWVLLPDDEAPRLLEAYGDVDDATVRRARGWAVLRALVMIDVGRNGRLGLPGGKPTWEAPGHAALDRLLAPR